MANNTESDFSWTDASCAAYTADDKYIVISPNVDFVPEPFVGLVQVRMRADFRYGENDPFQWPQPLDSDSLFLSAIRHPYPATHRYAPIWCTPDRHADFEVIQGSVFTCLGLLRASYLAPLQRLVDEMDAIVDHHKRTIAGSKRRLSVFQLGMNQARERLLFFPATFRDQCFQLREMQRFWLLCRAYVDYDRLLAAEDHTRPVQNAYVGAFTTNPGDAQTLVRLGIPTWFILPNISADRAASERVLVMPRRPYDLVRKSWQDDAVPVYSGLSGPGHLRSICAVKHVYLDVSQSPLLWRHDFTASCDKHVSSTSCSSSSSFVQRTTAKSASKKHKGKFIDRSTFSLGASG